ncbi:DUF6786 family protein [Lutibacter citreus]|uniref:DUF6786 family protein n=1 Tax=Lutibacter citreus TaxID=2138210 RepID=UPI000DBE9AA7|nr:DUF6786 family protein [Lutibacter citreus]
MFKNTLIVVSSFMCLIISCNSLPKTTTFEEDIEVLKKIEDLTILKNDDAMIAVSGTYQARVFTSTSNGIKGRSYGYFNKRLIQNNEYKTNLTSLGGEGRLIFAPEVGKYATFFAPNTEQTANTISPSPDMKSKIFNELDRTNLSITSGNKMQIRNANSYIFELNVKRKISLKTNSQIQDELKITLNNNLKAVAFSAESWVRNIGKKQWDKEKGLLSIWDIGCIKSSPKTIVIIPTKNKIEEVTNYFTPLNSDRVNIKNGVVFYKADTNYMNKIGIQQENIKNVFGSYSPEINLLTICTFNFIENEDYYANCVWGHSKPYKGDVINIFNGEVNEELDRNWPFYEMETLSSQKELKPNKEIYHRQTIFHFEGAKEELNKISKKVLGVELTEIKI